MPMGVVMLGLVNGCDGLPKDNFGTLERIRSQKLIRVGAAEEPPWVEIEGEAVEGVEAKLVEAFARTQEARVQWTRGSQSALAERLHKKQLDIVVGGFDDKTPLDKKMVLTQPYVTARNAEGKKTKRVLAVMPGESRLLFALDSFLLGDKEAKSIAATVGELP